MSAHRDGTAGMTMEFRVPNELGLHARPAAVFVKTANRFHCDISVHKGSETANGKSIISLLLLAAEHDSHLIIEAHGQDAHQALAELQTLIQSRFGEQA